MIKLFDVPVIMGCALVGTVGMIEMIKRIDPNQFGKKDKNIFSYAEKTHFNDNKEKEE
ncbi:MAG: hypothetical protein NC203_07280 [Firmicutes bacterium]|nr:hypothetical protein [Bacillota bacterium]